jgi:hypothetical protein
MQVSAICHVYISTVFQIQLTTDSWTPGEDQISSIRNGSVDELGSIKIKTIKIIIIE